MRFRYLLFLFFAVLLFPMQSQALTLSPSLVNIETEPDVPKSQTFKIVNDGGKRVRIQVFSWELIIDKNGKKNYFPAKKGINSLSKYIEIVDKDFILEPNAIKDVTVVFKTPASLNGGNSAVLFFNASDPIDRFFKTKVAMNIRVGATILQSTKGSSEFKSRISDLSITRKSADHPLELKMSVVNTGNTYLVGTGLVSIINNKNEFLGSFDIGKKIVTPKKEANFTKEINLSLDPGQYHALTTYKYRDKTVNIDKIFEIH